MAFQYDLVNINFDLAVLGLIDRKPPVFMEGDFFHACTAFSMRVLACWSNFFERLILAQIRRLGFKRWFLET